MDLPGVTSAAGPGVQRLIQQRQNG
jgi:hypothetical protein